ncbi:MAG: ABC transporter ATP-binding protein [Cellvibrionaceae bacterium]|nr:ABC transporter ATP-binding protein [Cellvibrionaceae bacterium]
MIEIQDLHFHRMEGQQQRSIIQGLHLSLGPGEQLALLGDSGAGKTTLLHIMAGMLPAQRGKVVVNHTVLQHCNKSELAQYRRAIGLIFQDYQLLEALNVGDNVLFQWRLQAPAISKAAMKIALQAMAEKLGIAHRLKAYPHQLSGGEQQRVAIARALIHTPKVVFADEPTGNLDQQRSLEVMALLTDLCRQQNINLVMVTHSRQLAQYFPLIKQMKHGQLQCVN